MRKYQSTMDLVIEHFETIAKQHDVKLYIDLSFSNKGAARFRDEFSTILEIFFDFQPDSSTYGFGDHYMSVKLSVDRFLIEHATDRAFNVFFADIHRRLEEAGYPAQ